MSKPNIAVVIEPSVNGKIVYEPAGRDVVSGKPVGIICLRLSIQNLNHRRWVHLTKVTLSFSKPPAVPAKVIPVPDNWPGVLWLDESGNPVQGTGVRIAPGATFVWSFFRDVVNVVTNEFENDTAVVPLPAPASLTLSLFCKGCSSPWKVTRKLAAHTNPVAGGAYTFPARVDDLRPDEFWLASSNTHGTGADGSQLFGYDMEVFAFDPEETDAGRQSDGLNRIRPGKDGSKNKHYRVWGKKIRAMAAGTVVHFLEGVGANYFPGSGDEAGPWQESPWDNPDLAWSDHVGAGNHFYIQHGDEVVLYAHMQEGSLNKKLLRVGAQVKAGQSLGLAGNAGSSSEPHLHIHSIKGTAAEDGPLRPLLFRDTFAVDPAALSFPSNAGPWARLRRQGPPAIDSGAFIWPLNRNPEWKGWQDLGGKIKSGPAVASWGVDRLDVFAASGGGKLKHKWWDGSAWHAWQTLGGTFKGAPAAVSWGPDRIDVFVRGMDDHLGHLWWDGDEWKGWQDLGGPIKSSPAVCSWGEDRLDVFAAGSDGELKHQWWDGSTWSGWQNLGGEFKNRPAAVSWGPGRIDVFVRGLDDHLGHLWWSGTKWQGWQDLGNSIKSAPAVSSWGEDRLDVFAAGSDDQLTHKTWDGTAWSNWDWIGGDMKGSPAAVSWGTGRIDVFVRGTDNRLGHLWVG